MNLVDGSRTYWLRMRISGRSAHFCFVRPLACVLVTTQSTTRRKRGKRWAGSNPCAERLRREGGDCGVETGPAALTEQEQTAESRRFALTEPFLEVMQVLTHPTMVGGSDRTSGETVPRIVSLSMRA
eukprot:scaffold1518_cov417-Prasinococcus_capsulatus_cf.AAC.41